MGIAEKLEPVLKKYQDLGVLVDELVVATSKQQKADVLKEAAKVVGIDLKRGMRGQIPLAATPQDAEDERANGTLSKKKMIVDGLKEKAKRILD